MTNLLLKPMQSVEDGGLGSLQLLDGCVDGHRHQRLVIHHQILQGSGGTQRDVNSGMVRSGDKTGRQRDGIEGIIVYYPAAADVVNIVGGLISHVGVARRIFVRHDLHFGVTS